MLIKTGSAIFNQFVFTNKSKARLDALILCFNIILCCISDESPLSEVCCIIFLKFIRLLKFSGETNQFNNSRIKDASTFEVDKLLGLLYKLLNSAFNKPSEDENIRDPEEFILLLLKLKE